MRRAPFSQAEYPFHFSGGSENSNSGCSEGSVAMGALNSHTTTFEGSTSTYAQHHLAHTPVRLHKNRGQMKGVLVWLLLTEITNRAFWSQSYGRGLSLLALIHGHYLPQILYPAGQWLVGSLCQSLHFIFRGPYHSCSQEPIFTDTEICDLSHKRQGCLAPSVASSDTSLKNQEQKPILRDICT